MWPAVGVADGGNARVGAAFWAAFRELMATDAPAIDAMHVEELGDITVTPQALAALGDLLAEG